MQGFSLLLFSSFCCSCVAMNDRVRLASKANLLFHVVAFADINAWIPTLWKEERGTLEAAVVTFTGILDTNSADKFGTVLAVGGPFL